MKTKQPTPRHVATTVNDFGLHHHGVLGFDSSQIMEALASVGRRTHVPLDVSTRLLEASAGSNKLTAQQMTSMVSELGNINNHDFYTFLGNAIANEVDHRSSLHHAIGTTLGHLFGPAKGVVCCVTKSRLGGRHCCICL